MEEYGIRIQIQRFHLNVIYSAPFFRTIEFEKQSSIAVIYENKV